MAEYYNTINIVIQRAGLINVAKQPHIKVRKGEDELQSALFCLADDII